MSDEPPTTTESYQAITCCECGIKFWIPTYIYQTSLVRGDKFTMWCPNGHSQYFEMDGPDDDDGEKEAAEVVRFPVISGGKAK